MYTLRRFISSSPLISIVLFCTVAFVAGSHMPAPISVNFGGQPQAQTR